MVIIRLLRFIDELIGKLSVWGLTLFLMLMIGLTLINIALRWMSTTILWIEPLVRQLVFTSAFLGGIVATGAKRHIAIDAVGRLLESFNMTRFKLNLDRVIYIFCIVALVWLAYAGYLLVLLEKEFGRERFLGLHSSLLASVIPTGLLLIAYRFFYHLVSSFVSDQSSSQ